MNAINPPPLTHTLPPYLNTRPSAQPKPLPLLPCPPKRTYPITNNVDLMAVYEAYNRSLMIY